MNNFMDPFESGAKKSNMFEESQMKFGYNTARHSDFAS